jgi:hypothetical protein
MNWKGSGRKCYRYKNTDMDTDTVINIGIHVDMDIDIRRKKHIHMNKDIFQPYVCSNWDKPIEHGVTVGLTENQTKYLSNECLERCSVVYWTNYICSSCRLLHDAVSGVTVRSCGVRRWHDRRNLIPKGHDLVLGLATEFPGFSRGCITSFRQLPE